MIDLIKDKNKYFTKEELLRKKTTTKSAKSSKEKPVIDQKKEKVVDVNRYHDREGITIKKIDTGFWFIKNMKNFIFLINLILLIIVVVSWSYFLISFGDYLVNGMNKEALYNNRIAQSTFSGHAYFKKNMAKNIKIGNVLMNKLPNGRYDFLVKIINLNPTYYAKISYRIGDGELSIAQSDDFLLPGSVKYITALGVDLKWRPSKVKFIVNGIDWRRIDAHRYLNWEDFRSNHLDGILIEEKEFIPASDSSLTEKINLNSLKFTIKNNTAFNYYAPKFIILLYNNNKIISVHKSSIDEVISGNKYSSEIVFTDRISQVDDIQIFPDIDITRDDIYIDFKGDKNKNEG